MNLFHSIPTPILDRMHTLEEMDALDRVDGTGRLQRLRQIPPETGRFLALMAMLAPVGQWIEIGTSAGYSSMWIALACHARACKLTTYEILPEKAALARETFRLAGIEDVVDFVEGDALEHLESTSDIAFCFLDAEKEVYAACYELLVPRMVPGGILIADNAINHRETLAPMIDRALSDPRVDGMVMPVGKGELVCIKTQG